MNRATAVAIDGPSGAGKSTIARAAAGHLGFVYVDTGAMYRTIGLAAYRAGVALGDNEAVLPLLDTIEVGLTYQDGEQRVMLNGEDVSGLIRTPEMSKYASFVSAIPAVRAFLLETQRDMAKKHSVIMDGRDIGTVVLTDAELKLFMTASVETRAMRRHLENLERGLESNLEDITREVAERDYQDTHRENSPLKAAEDAIILDTSDMTIDEVVDYVMKLVEERI